MYDQRDMTTNKAAEEVNKWVAITNERIRMTRAFRKGLERKRYISSRVQLNCVSDGPSRQQIQQPFQGSTALT